MAEILSNNSIVQNAIEQQLNNEEIVEVEKLHFNPLRVYFGDDYVVNDYITMHQPKIGEIVKYGEKQYYSMVQTLSAIPSDMKSQLQKEPLN